ncbi:phage tail tape measure protein [Streptomyces sp. NPDC101118]|uniref:phage tail tape measure protein n=1 Tax=Streptomyces sp. NPDC101118 TaxID=3366109 RepID=UPI0037F161D0
MPNVGYAVLQIIPSVRGISGEIRRQLIEPMGDAGEEAGTAAGGRMTDKLKLGAAAAGAAAGALLVAGLSEAMGQLDITSKLQAQLGATGKDAARYGKVAGALYTKGVTESFEQGAEVIRSIMNAGLVKPDATNAQLESIASKMTDVATTFGTDMSMQTQAVSALLKNNLAPSAESALDIITVGFQKLGPNAEDLLETFQEYPVQLRKLGLDANEALGLFQQGLQGGARDTDIIADGLKEFSIRAIDMSTTSQDAYKALGLSAQDMSAKIAKGGQGAQEGLQLVLDRLRGIKDPVAQNAAAVGLFGTQAEDLGAALFKLDPSKAAGAFGQVTGSAATLGKTLHSGPSHEIKVFTRAVQQTFVDFIGGKVLPLLSDWAHAFNDDVLPALKSVTSVLADLFLPVLEVLWTGLQSTIGFLKEWGVWLAPLVVLIGGVALALNAQALAAGIAGAATATWAAITKGVTLVTEGFAAAQALLNAVLALNPITLIVIALVALGTALVIAYKKSETFRQLVQAAWEGIKTAALWVWNSVLKPILGALVIAFKWVATVALWLWNAVFKPVFSFIAAAAKILATILIVIVVGPIIAIFKILAAIVGWLWRTFIKPVFQLIGFLAMWLWNNAIKPAFEKVVGVFKFLAFVAKWLWSNVIKPVFEAIGEKILEWWRKVRTAFDIVVYYIKNVLAPAFMRFWTNTIKPVWEGIKKTISAVWENGIKPTFDFLMRGVNNIKDSFKTGVSAIGLIWDRLKAIAKKPVQFIIDTVYNNGIRKLWNTVADFTGADKLNVIKFAQGGRTRGGTPGRDSIPALMMADEYVIRRSSARKLGFGTLDYINRHGALPGFAAGGPIQRFKDGGIVGWVKDKAKGIGSFFSDITDLLANPGKAWTAATGFIRRQLNSIAGTGFGRLMTGIPLKILSTLKDKVVSLVGAGDAGKVDVGGSGVQRWASLVLQALRLVGQPASYLAITLRRMNQESGGNPNAINNWDINAKNGTPSKGLMQVIDPTFNAYAGALRGRGVWDPLANIYASMRYALSRYGSLPAAYNRPGGYDSGGWLMPGRTLTFNGTGKPEAVLTPSQWTTMTRLAVAAAAAAPARLQAAAREERGGLQPGQPIVLQIQDGPTLKAYVKGVAGEEVTAYDRSQSMRMAAGRRI